MPQNISVEEYEKLSPVAQVNYEGSRLNYVVPNRMTLWRVQTLVDKEPETLAWIKSFGVGDTLVDVGANVGMYTVLAAVTRRARVFAFEPEAHNFSLLNRNIVANGLSQQAIAWCAALSDAARFDRLYLNSCTPGDSCHSFAEQVDFALRPRVGRLVQGCCSTTLDALVRERIIPAPDHIKIDVDGFEHKVIAGAREVLASASLRSLLVEINTGLAEHLEMLAVIERAGFGYARDQMEQARVKEGPFAGVANVVFTRTSRIGTLPPRSVAAPHLRSIGLGPRIACEGGNVP